MGFLSKFRLPHFTIKSEIVSDDLNSDKARRAMIADAAILFEKIFGRYGTSHVDGSSIKWNCDEKPPVTAHLAFNGKGMTLEVSENSTLIKGMTAIYFIFLIMAVLVVTSLWFFFYMDYFFNNPSLLLNKQYLWQEIEKSFIRWKRPIIFSWSAFPFIATFLVLTYKRGRLLLYMKIRAAALKSALNELVKSPGSTGLPGIDRTPARYFDIRLRGSVKLPASYDLAASGKGFAAINTAIDKFLQTGHFIVNVPHDKTETSAPSAGYDRKVMTAGDSNISLTMYYYRDSINFEAREDHSLEWIGMGARISFALFFVWLASYGFVKDYILAIIRNNQYYKASSLHMGIIFTGLLLLLAVSMFASIALEVYWRRKRYRLLQSRFMKLLDEAGKIVNA